MKVGLFFGSFNPVHLGHLKIAETVLKEAALDEVWLVVSPQNPFKESEDLLDERDRLRMVKAAVSAIPHIKACDVEFSLSRPSYTYNTLVELRKRYPDTDFTIIVGEDILDNFHKWKKHSDILEEFGLCVYPRPKTSASPLKKHHRVRMVEAPLYTVSSTEIRDRVTNGRSIAGKVPAEVERMIEKESFYID